MPQHRTFRPEQIPFRLLLVIPTRKKKETCRLAPRMPARSRLRLEAAFGRRSRQLVERRSPLVLRSACRARSPKDSALERRVRPLGSSVANLVPLTFATPFLQLTSTSPILPWRDFVQRIRQPQYPISPSAGRPTFAIKSCESRVFSRGSAPRWYRTSAPTQRMSSSLQPSGGFSFATHR